MTIDWLQNIAGWPQNINCIQRDDQECQDIEISSSVHFSWSQHLELARAVSLTTDSDRGTALALMGVGLTLLLKDLEQTVANEQLEISRSLLE